jgi:NADH:ubiquinone oxidoreductase subunit 5 (subunit L)/multisubunit Na+/H+ antiporter MnhA subunit
MAYLHVVLHALFKSLLFLGCGVMISHTFGNQDSRIFGYSFGGVVKLCFFSRAVRLVGFPFSVGFFSKDTIILTGSFLFLNKIRVLLFFFGCIFTVFYTGRLIYYGFVLEPYFFNFRARTESYKVEVSVFIL